MSVLIPLERIASISAPRPILFSGNQEGTLGGPTLPVPRVGDRFAIDVETTQFRQDAESRLLIAALTEATTEDARIMIRQQNHGLGGMYGSPVVDGAGQSGTTLLLRGVVADALARRGEFFGVVHGGVRFTYMVRAQAIADAAGKVAVPIWPMLRFLTVDGEACEFGQTASLEGQLTGFDGKGAVFVRNKVNPLQFTITERA